MFKSTVPFGESELMRVSAFRRYLYEAGGPRAYDQNGSGKLRKFVLSPSLLADLSRFEHGGHSSEVLEVLAACVRHSQQVVIYLQMNESVMPLTIFPVERLVHCPIGLEALLEHHLSDLRVLHVEPAVVRPPGHRELSQVGETRHYHSLGSLMWEIALRGSRCTLLPEIAGPVAYRVAPSIDLGALRANSVLSAAIHRLRRDRVTLRDIAEWPGLDVERAARLLNALYLQSGLILSRTHHPGVGLSWLSSLRRKSAGR